MAAPLTVRCSVVVMLAQPPRPSAMALTTITFVGLMETTSAEPSSVNLNLSPRQGVRFRSRARRTPRDWAPLRTSVRVGQRPLATQSGHTIHVQRCEEQKAPPKRGLLRFRNGCPRQPTHTSSCSHPFYLLPCSFFLLP